MTHLLYQTDSYLKTFSSVVSAVDEVNRGVVLEQSAFYPGGGGQPADSGTLLWDNASLVVTRAKKIGADVFHYISGDGPLPSVQERISKQRLTGIAVIS